jgi:plasmid stability protein
MKQKNETLIIRQIPPDLKRAFKIKCAENGISLQAQAIELMRRWVEEK